MYDVIVSSGETTGAFDTGFVTVNLQHPTLEAATPAAVSRAASSAAASPAENQGRAPVPVAASRAHFKDVAMGYLPVVSRTNDSC